MWTEFEWENRVNVSTTLSYATFSTVYTSCLYILASEPREYLKHIMKSTNMSCLTPEGAMAGDSDFLSANMYARSLFGTRLFSLLISGDTLIVLSGEDALANLSIERLESGTITGHVRIRSKTQGIALSLGDRITMGAIIVPLLGLATDRHPHAAQKGSKVTVKS